MSDFSILDWLLEPDEPVICWWTLRDLLDRPPDDPDVEEIRRAIPASEPARTILGAQRPRGTWANEKHLYSPKHMATHWQLDLLADFGFTAADAPVRRACDLFFAWQLPSGAFGMTKGDAGEEPCVTGRTLCQFERFGLGGEEGVLRAWAGLEATQRRDGGWHCRHTPLRMRPDAPSCFLATFKVLQACAIRRGGPPEMAWRAAALVKERLLDPRMDRYTSPTTWERFTYPDHWYDAISALDLLSGFGYGPDDERIARAVEFVLSKQRPDGAWADNGPLAFRGETLYPFGAPGEASKWITFRALRALKRAGTNVSLAPAQPSGGQ
jgi:Prenyltransferase and squalene oxidase repeat